MVYTTEKFFYTVKIDFIHSLWMMASLSMIKPINLQNVVNLVSNV